MRPAAAASRLLSFTVAVNRAQSRLIAVPRCLELRRWKGFVENMKYKVVPSEGRYYWKGSKPFVNGIGKQESSVYTTRPRVPLDHLYLSRFYAGCSTLYPSHISNPHRQCFPSPRPHLPDSIENVRVGPC